MPVAVIVTREIAAGLRNCFTGVTIVAAFNAVVVGLGAVILGVVVLLANGLLQNLLQPLVFGATLSLNPLAVLIVTIGGGALFGMVGLTLAAPLTSAAVHISEALREGSAADIADLPAATAVP